MIDSKGYRANVGIILCNKQDAVLWAKRNGQKAWQFPQGGIRASETPREAMYRELFEEVGLTADEVDVLGETQGWLKYDIPKHLQRKHAQPLCIGQRQKWFLLRLKTHDSAINLKASDHPEFDYWEWVAPTRPPEEVIYFKQAVYRRALSELLP